VAAARGRIVAGGHQAQQRVEDGRLASGAPRARHHQRAGAVVQEAGIVRAQERADDRVVLVAGAGDRVVAPAVALELARHHVQGAAGDLVLEQRQGLARAQGRARAQRLVGRERTRRRLGLGQATVEGRLDHRHAVGVGVDAQGA
jgi:hypothetical protein